MSSTKISTLMLLKDITDCSTYSVRGLDNQLVAQINKIKPGLLVRIDDLNVTLGSAVHPYLQAPAKKQLAEAIAQRGKRMTINSAYRTIAAQMLLRSHALRGRCNIKAAAPPGQSNHNGATAIDIEDSQGWRSALHANEWKWIGTFDPMHYDFAGGGTVDLNKLSIIAFQQLWNLARPNDKLTEDGDFGKATESRLLYSPAEGFAGVGIPRILKATEPFQIGDDVGDLQLALRKSGIEVKVADKVFGADTDTDVKEFQEQQGLVSDGIVGEQTRKLLGI